MGVTHHTAHLPQRALNLKSCVLPIFSSGTLKTLIDLPLRLKKKYFDDVLLRKSTFPHYRMIEHHFPVAKSGF